MRTLLHVHVPRPDMIFVKSCTQYEMFSISNFNIEMVSNNQYNVTVLKAQIGKTHLSLMRNDHPGHPHNGHRAQPQ